MVINYLLQTTFVLIVLFWVPQLKADDPMPIPKAIQIDGIYTGTMNLTDERVRSVPLDLSITMNNQWAVNPESHIFDKQRLLTSQFIVDGEGGKFNFKSVQYNIETGRIDFLYYKKSSDTPDLWLEGTLRKDLSIDGIVHSGLRGGPIGNFLIKKDEREIVLNRHLKYSNTVWKGTLTWILENNEKTPMEIKLDHNANIIYPNENYEIENTLDISGSVRLNSDGTTSYGISRIEIDYLRHVIKLTIIVGANKIELSCDEIDFDQGVMSGHASGTLNGNFGIFTLKRVD